MNKKTLLKAGWAALAALLVMVILLPNSPAGAATPIQAQPTPTPAGGQAQGEGSVLMMIVGAVVMVAPMIYMAWKSRGAKQPDIRAASCLPVIDESKRPFRMDQDQEEKTEKHA